MAKIFISYSRTDLNIVKPLIPMIGNIYGEQSYWYDTAIQGGNDWWQVIESEIQACQVFMFLMSDKSISSDYCISELRKALQHRKQVLQVLLPTLTIEYKTSLPRDLQQTLSEIQYVDLREGFDQERNTYNDLSRLWGALNNLISNRRLSLTLIERWILHNQFEILKQLSQDHSADDDDFFSNAMEILAKGYEWYYGEISQYIYTQTFPYQDSLEVVNILDMFRFLEYAYQALEDPSEIDKSAIEFDGFSGNEETAELQFTRFMMDSMKTFDYLKPKSDLNSHVPMLDVYRRMLAAWNISRDKYDLAKDDIIRIAQARYFR